MREWMYRSLILDHGISRSWVVSFTPRLLCLRGKNLRYPTDRRLHGPQNWSDVVEEKNLAPTRLLGCPARGQSLLWYRQLNLFQLRSKSIVSKVFLDLGVLSAYQWFLLKHYYQYIRGMITEHKSDRAQILCSHGSSWTFNMEIAWS
jgi:hypothetical protein